MPPRAYVPDTGEVVWLEFDRQAGHEQAEHRPALVKGHPFEVLTEVDGIEGAVLSDQVSSLDWKIRRAKKKATVSADVTLHVRAKIKALLQIP